MLREGTTAVIRREDYCAPAFWIDTVDLTFDLDPVKTRVLNKMTVRRNPSEPVQALRLDGEELNLSRVMVNGQGTSFKIDGNQLVLENLPQGNDAFELEIFSTCNPKKNTQLSGLYVSQSSFFTQCEAQGFRRITYFLDRPDVMAIYTVTLRADKQAYPVLLSNGNLIEQGNLQDGKHFTKWVDPHKKPAYLFALVAGNLVCREQRITARSGKEHLLQVYVRSGDLYKTDHAMHSLMASIAWDEARFSLSLDLERFMIVATSDFNMGAMENKGLNIFNTKYVLASPSTASDTDYANIESVVGHEYFHNWTGNRITCRDWFQLSLKEGLTVFRDQEFSQDLAGTSSARAVKRIEDVRVLRTVQFAEDAGPMAHPVRPDSYIEINNFYTVTIYEKGAEVVRMMQTLVGREGFAKGMKLYFERHDGQAVTCDDFAQCIADANPTSALSQHLDGFKRWYTQAGTPHVHAHGHYDADAQRYTLLVKQSCSPTPSQLIKQAFVIPVELGLIAKDGSELLAYQLRVITEPQHTWVFEGITHEPVPSLLRGFSAPVILETDLNEDQWLTLMAHDSDAFNRWEAAQRLCLQSAIRAIQQDTPPQQVLSDALLQAMRVVLRHPQLDAAFKDLVLTMPSETYMAEQLSVVDPLRIHQTRENMHTQIAMQLKEDWIWAFENHNTAGTYEPDAVSSGRRALKSLALTYLCLADANANKSTWHQKALHAYKHANNMTDRSNALSALVNCGADCEQEALQHFHSTYQKEELVLDKWFALQAGAADRDGQGIHRVRKLMNHADFNLHNPNRARSLISTFCHANQSAFHRADAAGYVFWAERVIEIDGFNHQVAARLARALDRWRKLAEPYRSSAHEAIQRVAASNQLSNDVLEVVLRALEE
ncbi:MAG: aminopeptidase N [Limnohabitans sp.]|nr:aminopeptidase N [Limnohabitans sp.]